jgi:G3E family GTPase
MNHPIKFARIPVTLITGFLGAGKTTLLKRLLHDAHGKRIAVIENEFGEVSIDDHLLGSDRQTIFKMSNGCLCCTVSGDLVKTLLELAERRDEFDYVIIETTGLANPAPVVQTFLLNEDISDSFQLDGIVTLVDALHLNQHFLSRECKAQIAFADVVLINKLDLVEPSAAAELERKIRRVNRLASVVPTRRSEVDLRQILDIGASSTGLVVQPPHGDEHDCAAACGHEHNHGGHGANHDEHVQSVGFEFEEVLDQAKFNAWFGGLVQCRGDDIYRSKGILSVRGRDNQVILHTVHRVVEVTAGAPWGDDKRTNKLVFIGRNLDRTELSFGLQSCLVER